MADYKAPPNERYQEAQELHRQEAELATEKDELNQILKLLIAATAAGDKE